MGFHDDYSPRTFDGNVSYIPRSMTWEEDQKEREMYRRRMAKSKFIEWQRTLEHQSNSWESAIDQMDLDRGGESTIEIKERNAAEFVRYNSHITRYF